MSSRPILMIPGPVELPPTVQSAGTEPPASHMDERFVASFGDALRLMRAVWKAPSGQPFVVSGSGTLQHLSHLPRYLEQLDIYLLLLMTRPNSVRPLTIPPPESHRSEQGKGRITEIPIVTGIAKLIPVSCGVYTSPIDTRGSTDVGCKLQ